MITKKYFFTFLLLITLFSPVLAFAQGLVPCGQPNTPMCKLEDIFVLISNVYNFIVWKIATPLAGILVVIGGVIIMISGGPGGANPVTGIVSPNMYNKGKSIVTGAIGGWLLVFCSWLIINAVLLALGLPGY
mgnify:CR=1 FL=1